MLALWFFNHLNTITIWSSHSSHTTNKTEFELNRRKKTRSRKPNTIYLKNNRKNKNVHKKIKFSSRFFYAIYGCLIFCTRRHLHIHYSNRLNSDNCAPLTLVQSNWMRKSKQFIESTRHSWQLNTENRPNRISSIRWYKYPFRHDLFSIVANEICAIS